MPLETIESLRKRVITSFMDILILNEIKKGALSGYDIIDLLQKRFGVLVSPGTVYNVLYSLERDGLIKNIGNRQKRVYQLTDVVEQNIKIYSRASEEIHNLVENISILNRNPRPSNSK